MITRLTIALAALIACSGACAAIAPGTSGNGELFLNVVDDVTKISYTKDLGVFMDDFFVLAQQDRGVQLFWAIESANWTSFQSLAVLDNLRWSVVAIDSTGNNNPGNQRLFSTIRQGNEANVTNGTNLNFSNGIGATQAGNFFNAINDDGTHGPPSDYAVNGDSYAYETDDGRAYYGESGGLTPTYNGTATFNATNVVGESSWFYYITRSSTSSTGRVIVDEFDNGNPTDGGNDGYWGFVKVNDSDPGAPFYDPTSPFAGKYLLSFTMAAFDLRTTAAFRSFAAGIGRTEYSGGFYIRTLDGAAAAAVGETAAGWSRRLGSTELAVSPVPEPAAGWLFMTGAAALAWRLRRRR
jgi:hypothetical protein